MRLSRTLNVGLLALASAVPLFSMTGCGDGLPETGTAASPVNPEVAASQNKAMQDLYKNKKASPRAKN